MQGRVRLFDAPSEHRPAALLWRDEMPGRIVAAHVAAIALPPVELVRVTDDVVYGGMGLFARNGAVWHEPGIQPAFVNNMFVRMGVDHGLARNWLDGLLGHGTHVVNLDGPVLVPLHPQWNYGHFLIEMLPRALVMDQVCPPDWPVLVAFKGHGWLENTLRTALPGRMFQRYDPSTQVVHAPMFVGCTDLMTATSVRPEARTMIEMLKVRILLGDPADAATKKRDHPADKLFLSRRAITKGRHKVENREEIERAICALGYTVIRPEELSFADQIRAMDNARIIVGEYGSALHNAIFARPGTTVVCLNWINSYQSQIASLFGHTIGYIPPDDGQFRDSDAIWSGNRSMRFSVPQIIEKLSRLEDAVVAAHVTTA